MKLFGENINEFVLSSHFSL